MNTRVSHHSWPGAAAAGSRLAGPTSGLARHWRGDGPRSAATTSSTPPPQRDIKILLFNNEIYGLTGRSPPTLPPGHPSVEPARLLRCASVAVAGDCRRSGHSCANRGRRSESPDCHSSTGCGPLLAVDSPELKNFNDGVSDYVTDKSSKADNAHAEHGKPMIFGRTATRHPPTRATRSGTVGKDCASTTRIHDETATNATMAYLLSRMMVPSSRGLASSKRQPSDARGTQQKQMDCDYSRGQGDGQAYSNDDLWVVEWLVIAVRWCPGGRALSLRPPDSRPNQVG